MMRDRVGGCMNETKTIGQGIILFFVRTITIDVNCIDMGFHLVIFIINVDWFECSNETQYKILSQFQIIQIFIKLCDSFHVFILF